MSLSPKFGQAPRATGPFALPDMAAWHRALGVHHWDGAGWGLGPPQHQDTKLAIPGRKQ